MGRVAGLLDGVRQLAAHNVSFDRGVMKACCEAAGLEVPRLPWGCTVELARQVWGIRPTKLSDVWQRLEIPLDHHEAQSDAEACAKIILAARGVGGGARLLAHRPR